MKRIIRGIFAVVVILVVVGLLIGSPWLRTQYQNFTVALPKYAPVEKTVWLEQHWSATERDWFHHADQGTQTFDIPYEWFMALEQPALSLGAPGLLSDTTYLDRYGFIPSAATAGQPELPIGFAHNSQALDSSGAVVRNPQTKQVMTSLGLTCAACHTGRFTFQNTTVLIDGAPALTNVQKFQKAVGLSVIYTHYVPFRFDRFAERVLGAGASAQAKAELRTQFERVVQQFELAARLEKGVQANTIEEGYTRLDALTRIGNTVFAIDLDRPENHDSEQNFKGYSAPVHYPRIWNAPWFTWVQYNGSIEQPMTRNAGEALGVGARVRFSGAQDQLFSSSIRLDEVFELEKSLAGAQPDATAGFSGLASPKWPSDILPPINTELAAKGAALYKVRCQGCHLPPVSDPDFWTSPKWLPPNSAGRRYLDLNMIDIAHVGTDSAQATDMQNRTVVIPTGLGIEPHNFGGALGKAVELVVNRWYDTHQPPTPAATRDEMNGFRANGIRAPLQYKARPLNGIWATPPYLHNASVPNLYALLSPVAERPQTFYLGNREYDPVNVGYRIDELAGGFKLDTSIRGNSNSGHEFNNTAGPGVIGPLLTPEERRALIEFLKTL